MKRPTPRGKLRMTTDRANAQMVTGPAISGGQSLEVCAATGGTYRNLAAFVAATEGGIPLYLLNIFLRYMPCRRRIFKMKLLRLTKDG
ncbi:MAG TPA: hypothetical protein DCG19_04220 [Cryomorphaceae bacterium]|nr:hypothetical protein [Owenweeksia sp.]MBF99604.1 hypothetical protein [Owenweeksia sp.]HAD96587.1 hypothetical protein [Cryomorphaceae bacterium]